MRRFDRWAAGFVVPILSLSLALPAWAEVELGEPPVERADTAATTEVEPAGTATWSIVDRHDRNAMQEAYRWDYLWKVDDVPPILQHDFGWNGDVDSCDAGDVPSATRDRALAAINYFRSVAGVPPVVFEHARNQKDQEAALMMDANNALSHNPAPDWDCYTDDGAEAAGASNLSFGTPRIRFAIEGYMHDPGPSNTPVGHRRWFLSPGAEEMGFGSTDDVTAVWVTHGNPAPAGTPKWIPFPGDGFWPKQLMTLRWSLSTPEDADFSEASVTLTHEGQNVEIEVHPIVPGYGYLDTITWDVTDPDFGDMVLDSGDSVFEVTVEGIWLGSEQVDRTYTVTAFNAIPNPLTDVADSSFARDAVYLQWTGVTQGCNPPANDQFCPDDLVTRGQMAAFLVRALEYTDDGGGDLFIDDDGSTFESDIDKLAANGVTRGCNPPANDQFCPDDLVTRGQMAAFLVRALGYTDDGGGDLFIDDNSSVFESDIDRLAVAEVTKGCNPPANDRFCPDDFVTRGQMAAFLHRAFAGS